MITVAQVVQDMIAGQPFLEEGLDRKLINLTALARRLQPDVQAQLLKPVQVGAIVMALKRYAPPPHLLPRRINRVIEQIGDITVKSQLMEFTVQNTDTLRYRIQAFTEQHKLEADFYCTVSQGIHETTLITKQSFQDELRGLLSEEQKFTELQNLSALTVKLPPENVGTSGVYYQLLKLLAWEGVNLVELVSTANELTMVMHESDVDRALGRVLRVRRAGGAVG